MAIEPGTPEAVVERYFSLLGGIHEGDAAAVEKILDLWHEDGQLTYCGSPPTEGALRGRPMLAGLYKNLAGVRGIRVDDVGGEEAPAVLASTAAEVTRVRSTERKAVAEWTSTVETEDGRRFTLAGSNTFVVEDGRIASLDIVLSPRPSDAAGFRTDDLTQVEVGRLALAAWAVV